MDQVTDEWTRRWLEIEAVIEEVKRLNHGPVEQRLKAWEAALRGRALYEAFVRDTEAGLITPPDAPKA